MKGKNALIIVQILLLIICCLIFPNGYCEAYSIKDDMQRETDSIEEFSKEGFHLTPFIVLAMIITILIIVLVLDYNKLFGYKPSHNDNFKHRS
jgi:hypothetical protein